MNVVIAGAGLLGRNLAKTLIKENIDVTIIEKNPQIIAKLEKDLDALLIEGNAAILLNLKKCNLKDKDYFISVTGVDEANIISCMLAKKISNVKTIARFGNLDYSEMIESDSDIVSDFGIDYIINTNKVAAKEILKLIHIPTALDIDSFVRGNIEMIELNVSKDSEAVNKTLKEKIMPPKSIIAAINREGKMIIPSGNIKIKPKDRVIVFYDPSVFDDVQRIFSKELIGLNKERKVFIVGASRIALKIATMLEDEKFNVVLFDKDKNSCNLAASKLNKTVVINADAALESTLLLENIDNASTIVTLTSNDETNLLVSLLAKKLTDIKTISLVQKPALKQIFESIGVDVAISARLSAVGEILNYIKHVQASAVYMLGEGEFQALEIDVTEKSSVINKKLKDIKFPKDTLIGLIFREGKSIVPRGENKIKKGDKIAVLSSTGSAKKINQLLR